MSWIKKPNTYVDANGNTINTNVLVGTAQLVSPVNMTEKGLLTNKTSGKTYRLCTVRVTTASGKQTEYLAQVSSTTLKLAEEQNAPLKVGENFLTTLSFAPDNADPTKMRTFARMSHLRGVVENQEAIDEMLALFADEDVAANVAAPKLQEVEE